MNIILLLLSFSLFAQEDINSNRELIFEENFRGPINTQIWNVENPDLVEISPKNKLILKNEYIPILKETRSGRLNTKNKFDFKYGFIELKVHIPLVKGLLPEVMLKSIGPWPSIDIELYKQEKKKYHVTNAINWNRKGRVFNQIRQKKTSKLEPNSQNTYIFSLEWKPYELIFSIDGKEVWRKFVQVKFMKSAFIDFYASFDEKIEENINGEWAIDHIKIYKKL